MKKISVFFAMFLSLALVGCDREGDEGIRKIKLQLPWFPNGAHSYVYLGKKLDIFKKHGFDIEITGGRGSEVAARSLAAGSVDVAIVGGDALVLVRGEGVDLKSIGALYEDTPVTIYSLPEKNITTVEDLIGKRVGLLPGSNTFIQYEGLLNRLQINRSAIDEVNVNPMIAPSWILAGQGKSDMEVGDSYLDVLTHYTHFQPLYENTGEHPIKMNEILLKDLGVQIYGMSLAVRNGTFNDSEIAALRAAVKEAFLAARSDPDAAITALIEANPGQDWVDPVAGARDIEYARKQLDAVIGFACVHKEADCANAFAQDSALWDATITTLGEFGLLKAEMVASDIMVAE
jgi:ABC-type nitrate/sulfonate/bicarbonate transport system substrate-binding protein